MNQFEAFTKEQDDWIRANYFNMSVKDLTEEFNKHFNKKRSYAVMKQRCRRTLKLSHKITDEMKAFLIENYMSYSRKELTEAFNNHFGQNRTEGVIKVECQKLGLHFKDNRERFKRTRAEVQSVPLGTTVKRRNGYTAVKTEKGWKMLSTVIWENANGKKPSKSQIIYLDGDKDNCSLNNLYCVSGVVHRELIKRKWRFENPELTLTAIKLCELERVLKK